MARTSISITIRDTAPNPDYEVEVLAYVHTSGVFATHKSWGGKGWDVTHMPSGLRIAQGLPTRRRGYHVMEVAFDTSTNQSDLSSKDSSKAVSAMDYRAICLAKVADTA